MPVGSTDFGQGNGYAFANYYTAPSVVLQYPPAQINTTQSALVAFVCRIDRALLGSSFHPATYATVFGNTASPHTVNTILCRYYGPEEADVSLRNRFAFFITDSADTANPGPWPVVPGGGVGNVTVRVLSEPITTDGPVAVILQVYRSLNSSAVATLQRANVLTAHCDANGVVVPQQGSTQELTDFVGLDASCPPWALGAANTSGVVTGGNYWPGLLSQFVVGYGFQLTLSDVDAFFDGRWFPKSPTGVITAVAGRFARRLGYALSGVSAVPRPFSDVTDSLQVFTDVYPPITFTGTFRDGGCLTAIPIDHAPFKSARWAVRPRVDTLPSNLTVPRQLHLRCYAAGSGSQRTFTFGGIRYASTHYFNEANQNATYNRVLAIPPSGTVDNQVVTYDVGYSPIPDSSKQAYDVGLISVLGAGDTVLFAKQYSWSNCNRDVAVIDSHSKSGLLKVFSREPSRDPLGFSLVLRQPSGLYLRLLERRQLGLRQFNDVPIGELVVLDLSTQTTTAVAADTIVNTFRTEVLTATGRITRWIHAHHRYPTSEDSATIAATATTYLNTLYSNANFAGVAIAVLDPGRFGPESAAGAGASETPLFYQNMRNAYQTWTVGSANRRFVDYFAYAGDWDPANVPYMRVADTLTNITRYLRRFYLHLDILDRGLLTDAYVDFRSARFTNASKTEFVVRLDGPVGSRQVIPVFVTHTAGVSPALEISEDGGSTWLRPNNSATLGTSAYFSTQLQANGTIRVAKQANPAFSWAGLSAGQLRVRYGYGYPLLNVEVPAGVSGSAAYQHIMAADGAVYQQSPLATPYFETGIPVLPFDIAVAEPVVSGGPGVVRSLSSTGAGR